MLIVKQHLMANFTMIIACRPVFNSNMLKTACSCLMMPTCNNW